MRSQCSTSSTCQNGMEPGRRIRALLGITNYQCIHHLEKHLSQRLMFSCRKMTPQSWRWTSPPLNSNPGGSFLKTVDNIAVSTWSLSSTTHDCYQLRCSLKSSSPCCFVQIVISSEERSCKWFLVSSLFPAVNISQQQNHSLQSSSFAAARPHYLLMASQILHVIGCHRLSLLRSKDSG